MAKHDQKIADQFQKNLSDVEKLDEQELLNRLNETIKAVEADDDYAPQEKLKIYALITSLDNCDDKDRMKFVRKIYKALR